jgi:hypothetical protein
MKITLTTITILISVITMFASMTAAQDGSNWTTQAIIIQPTTIDESGDFNTAVSTDFPGSIESILPYDATRKVIWYMIEQQPTTAFYVLDIDTCSTPSFTNELFIILRNMSAVGDSNEYQLAATNSFGCGNNAWIQNVVVSDDHEVLIAIGGDCEVANCPYILNTAVTTSSMSSLDDVILLLGYDIEELYTNVNSASTSLTSFITSAETKAASTTSAISDLNTAYSDLITDINAQFDNPNATSIKPLTDTELPLISTTVTDTTNLDSWDSYHSSHVSDLNNVDSTLTGSFTTASMDVIESAVASLNSYFSGTLSSDLSDLSTNVASITSLISALSDIKNSFDYTPTVTKFLNMLYGYDSVTSVPIGFRRPSSLGGVLNTDLYNFVNGAYSAQDTLANTVGTDAVFVKFWTKAKGAKAVYQTSITNYNTYLSQAKYDLAFQSLVTAYSAIFYR